MPHVYAPADTRAELPKPLPPPDNKGELERALSAIREGWEGAPRRDHLVVGLLQKLERRASEAARALWEAERRLVSLERTHPKYLDLLERLARNEMALIDAQWTRAVLSLEVTRAVRDAGSND